jgi:AcrR family transcriptional regulator
MYEAILDSTATLAAERGVLGVTMSQIAEEVGIGRATLYKYFSDVESILTAWHERQASNDLLRLVEVRDQAGEPGERLAAVLEAFAFLQYENKGGELESLLHNCDRISGPEEHTRALIKDLLIELVAAGSLRSDPSPDELAGYCFHALTAARSMSSDAAVRRLVNVILAGIKLA